MADAQAFKAVMSRWTTGISVITAARDDTYFGFTANSFASVSIEPLLISMSITKTLYTLEVIQETQAFAVNVLTAQQAHLGKRFAGILPEYEDNRFAGIELTLSDNGCPLLPSVLGWMDCKVYDQIDVGASILFLGEVTDAHVMEDDTIEPLAYYYRQWGRFVPQPDDD